MKNIVGLYLIILLVLFSVWVPFDLIQFTYNKQPVVISELGNNPMWFRQYNTNNHLIESQINYELFVFRIVLISLGYAIIIIYQTKIIAAINKVFLSLRNFEKSFTRYFQKLFKSANSWWSLLFFMSVGIVTTYLILINTYYTVYPNDNVRLILHDDSLSYQYCPLSIYECNEYAKQTKGRAVQFKDVKNLIYKYSYVQTIPLQTDNGTFRTIETNHVHSIPKQQSFFDYYVLSSFQLTSKITADWEIKVQDSEITKKMQEIKEENKKRKANKSSIDEETCKKTEDIVAGLLNSPAYQRNRAEIIYFKLIEGKTTLASLSRSELIEVKAYVYQKNCIE